jgi:hypothetical protein
VRATLSVRSRSRSRRSFPWNLRLRLHRRRLQRYFRTTALLQQSGGGWLLGIRHLFRRSAQRRRANGEFSGELGAGTRLKEGAGCRGDCWLKGRLLVLYIHVLFVIVIDVIAILVSLLSLHIPTNIYIHICIYIYICVQNEWMSMTL